MPNWCDSQLLVTGPQAVLDRFTPALRQVAERFPMFNADHFPPDFGEMNIDIRTAWEPPRDDVLNLSAEFPELLLVLRFVEPLGGFFGVLVCEAGKVICHRVRELDSSWREMSHGE